MTVRVETLDTVDLGFKAQADGRVFRVQLREFDENGNVFRFNMTEVKDGQLAETTFVVDMPVAFTEKTTL